MEADMTVSMIHRLKDDECEINDIMVDQNRLSAVLLQKNEGYGYLSKVIILTNTVTVNHRSCCESKIAHMRTKMKTFVASGKNMITAKDMKVTIDEGSSVVGCQIPPFHRIWNLDIDGLELKPSHVSKAIEFHITPEHRDKVEKRHEVSYSQELKRRKEYMVVT
ncbi:Hypothetical predicted protein [Mytilus galloprovincialis]|uniref:Uncharacterized protein n=1 Tax=Mytilus galloprovincialis TaxID=29158 RepID=A0A8B6DAK5_MYTGA|nr:Hypothetical predicted protein [Mytilus galloprovincialis]